MTMTPEQVSKAYQDAFCRIVDESPKFSQDEYTVLSSQFRTDISESIERVRENSYKERNLDPSSLTIGSDREAIAFVDAVANIFFIHGMAILDSLIFMLSIVQPGGHSGAELGKFITTFHEIRCKLQSDGPTTGVDIKH